MPVKYHLTLVNLGPSLVFINYTHMLRKGLSYKYIAHINQARFFYFESHGVKTLKNLSKIL